MPHSDALEISSENPLEQIWLHLARLESVPLARRAIAARADRYRITISDEVLDRKAVGVAYALRNARDYMERPSRSLTKQLLSSYYGMFSILTAVLIGNPDNDYDLEGVERASKFGHGLHSIENEAAAFPESQSVYVSDNGFFHHLLMDAGLSRQAVDGVKFRQRLKAYPSSSEDAARMVNLDVLFARIPELSTFYYEVTGRRPLNAKLFAPMYENREPTDEPLMWLGFRTPGFDTITTPDEEAARLALPLQNCRLNTSEEGHYAVGSCVVPSGTEWYHHLSVYSSAACPVAWVRPLFGTSSQLVVHFCLLYLLSIIVRYKPKLWREITEGGQTEYLALTRSYLAVFHRSVPQQTLEKLLDRDVNAWIPGSIYS